MDSGATVFFAARSATTFSGPTFPSSCAWPATRHSSRNSSFFFSARSAPHAHASAQSKPSRLEREPLQFRKNFCTMIASKAASNHAPPAPSKTAKLLKEIQEASCFVADTEIRTRPPCSRRMSKNNIISPSNAFLRRFRHRYIAGSCFDKTFSEASAKSIDFAKSGLLGAVRKSSNSSRPIRNSIHVCGSRTFGENM